MNSLLWFVWSLGWVRFAIGLRVLRGDRSLQHEGLVGRSDMDLNQTTTDTSATITNWHNTACLVDIWVGGAWTLAQLTAQTADLTLSGDILGANETAIEVPTFVGSPGNMSFVDVAFTSNVSEQIFVQSSGAYSGLAPCGNFLGLLPSVKGELYHAYESSHPVEGAADPSAGDSIIDRILQQNTSLPNIVTFTLNRMLHPSEESSRNGGIFTIGEVLPVQENIGYMPRLPVTISSSFGILVDSMTVNGQTITFPPSTVSGVPSGQLLAALDPTFPLSWLPPSVATAIYGSIPGASLVNITVSAEFPLPEYWAIPCSTELNISFAITGVDYPIHPLDANIDPRFFEMTIQDDLCNGGFQSAQSGEESDFDMMLSLPFLRNVYTLINYGNYTHSDAYTYDTPFIQLLNLTNPVLASQEFSTIRSSALSSSGNSTGSAGSGVISSAGNQLTAGGCIHRYLAAITLCLVSLSMACVSPS